jgi:hypothetical protein
MYTFFVIFFKKHYFIYLAIFSLLNLSIQSQNIAFAKTEKQQIKKFFLQTTHAQTVQREDFKHKRQVKNYLPEMAFAPTSGLIKFFIPKASLLSFRTTPIKNGFYFSKLLPRAPPLLSC